MSTDHERLSALFLEIRRLDPEERPRALAEARRADPELAAEVESMLRYDRDTVEALPGHGGGAAPDEAPAPLPESIGAYRVIARLGSGGMGEVFLASQGEPLPRRVAIKIVRSTWRPEALARFETERRILARLAHPNIARVFDAGSTDEGQPYFVMELVDGPGLINYCDRRRLAVPRRLDLFLQVCAGVQHAHQNAVIHRDLKPGNVLVTEDDGVPIAKVIDFGVAKAIEPIPGLRWNGHTRDGLLLGTPTYMSPEQAERDVESVDTRTDVYSLGAMLYELLCGSPPVDLSNIDPLDVLAIRRRLRDGRPTPPSRRLQAAGPGVERVARARSTDPRRMQRELRGDLDRIVSKALEKEPVDRYGSVGELAADLRRYRRREPVLAASQSGWYRLRKTIQRNRLVSTFAVSTALILVAFSILMAWQARWADSQRRAAETAVAMLTEAFDVASARDLRHGAFDPERLYTQGGSALEKRIAVDRTLSPTVRALLRSTLGNLYLRRGDLARSRPHLETAEIELTSLVGPEHRWTLGARSARALLDWKEHRSEKAETRLLDVIALSEALGETYADVRIKATRDLTEIYRKSGRPDEAATMLQTLLPTLAARLGPDDSETVIAESMLAGVMLDAGTYDQAREFLLTLRPRADQVLGPRHRESQVVIYNLACVHAQLGESERALQYLEQAMERGWSDPTTTAGDRYLAPLRGNAEFNRLLLLIQANAGARDGDIRWTAALHVGAGEYEKALRICEINAEATRRVFGVDHRMYQAAKLATASTRAYLGQFKRAEQELLSLLPALKPEDDEWDRMLLAEIDWQLARCRMGAGDLASTRVHIVRSLNACLLTMGGESASSLWARAALALLDGDRESALEYAGNALRYGTVLTQTYWAERDNVFAALHDDPEFLRMLKEKRESMGPQRMPFGSRWQRSD